MTWRCIIPGKAGGLFADGFYPLTMEFSEDYPSKPPKCKMPANFFHPNGKSKKGAAHQESRKGRRGAFFFAEEKKRSSPATPKLANPRHKQTTLNDKQQYTLRHHLPFDLERGPGVEAEHFDFADLARDPSAARRAQHGVPGAERGVHLPDQEPGRVRAPRPPAGAPVPAAVVREWRRAREERGNSVFFFGGGRETPKKKNAQRRRSSLSLFFPSPLLFPSPSTRT